MSGLICFWALRSLADLQSESMNHLRFLGLVAVSSMLAWTGMAFQRWRNLHMANKFTFYGFPDECHKFERRHPLWNEIMGNLVKAMNLAFTRMEIMEGAADKFIYFFGRI